MHLVSVQMSKMLGRGHDDRGNAAFYGGVRATRSMGTLLTALLGLFLCGAAFGGVKASSVPFYLTVNGVYRLYPREDLVGTVDADVLWSEYYAYIMSRERTTPLVVLFTSEECEKAPQESREGDEDEGDDGLLWGFTASDDDYAVHEACDAQLARLSIDVETEVAETVTREYPDLPVLLISKKELSQAFHQHRVPSSPALMWFPLRSSKTFQRFAHPKTNYLNISDSLASGKSVSSAITKFLRRSLVEGGHAMSGSTASAEEDSSFLGFLLNMLPLVALFAYIVLSIFEHREVIFKLLQNRFLWFILTQGVLYVSLSGLFHSIIHRVILFYAHPNYGVMLIHPSGRKQFFLEGLVHGSWSFLISFGVFTIVDVMPTVRSRTGREDLFRWSLLFVGASYAFLQLTFMSKHNWLMS
ncbi:hypothetical protein Poli38472_013396 [Pythium oligandrum]|uniref:Uncharacterized protein n=1 Tax=Pythium oligandrum TaxID=41045 RepID=A0A8K1C7F1_PYTOL|nr:hypothetical protein Poli38472_013396 [Pythium oligandrum]|eukprot:TMW57922.1 hypothetical protein Poli38472_013396 [Pythium oligandrum]